MNERLTGQQIGDLIRHIQEYRTNPHSPEVVTQAWQKIWQVWGERAGLTIPVSPCNWTEEEIQKPFIDIEGKPVSTMVIYRPEAIKDKEGLILLDKIFPQMDCHNAKDEIIFTDVYDADGWIKVEATAESPNRNTTEYEVELFFASQGRLEQREGTYIIASQANKLFTDHFFDEGIDEGTFSRLGVSRVKVSPASLQEYIIVSHFFPNGHLLDLLDQRPNAYDPELGARSERVKRT